MGKAGKGTGSFGKLSAFCTPCILVSLPSRDAFKLFALSDAPEQSTCDASNFGTISFRDSSQNDIGQGMESLSSPAILLEVDW